VSMRRVREILRLKYEAGASDRAIGLAVGVARSTARLCLDRATAAGLVGSVSARAR
jgi:DNA-binding transcriptional regulator LsrR (DeoR family)